MRDDGTVKVGRVIREQAQTLYTIRERLRQELGREPVLSELSEASGLTPEEIARNVGRIVVMRDAHVYMDGTPRQVFARAEELEQAGLDVPQVTKIAMALRRRGMDIDPAVYTIEELEQALLARRGGGEGC